MMLTAVMLGSAGASLAAVDRDGDGMSDIWEIIYGATGLAPGDDADGDGFSNAAEALAGTNPFDPTSFPRLRMSFLSPSNSLLSWESFAGKRYVLQSRTNRRLSEPFLRAVDRCLGTEKGTYLGPHEGTESTETRDDADCRYARLGWREPGRRRSRWRWHE